jgi:hypothetical protein
MSPSRLASSNQSAGKPITCCCSSPCLPRGLLPVGMPKTRFLSSWPLAMDPLPDSWSRRSPDSAHQHDVAVPMTQGLTADHARSCSITVCTAIRHEEARQRAPARYLKSTRYPDRFLTSGARQNGRRPESGWPDLNQRPHRLVVPSAQMSLSVQLRFAICSPAVSTLRNWYSRAAETLVVGTG